MSELTELADEVRALAQQGSVVVAKLEGIDIMLGQMDQQLRSLGRINVPTGAVSSNVQTAKNAVVHARNELGEFSRDGERFADGLA